MALSTQFSLAPTPATDPSRGLDAVRVGAALVLLVHPLHGLWSQGRWFQDIRGFGEALGAMGLPLGVPLAWAVILLQLGGVAALLVRRAVVPASLGLMALLGTGIALIHAREGWFVVGAGRNGMEFSVLLILCFGAVAWGHRPRRRA